MQRTVNLPADSPSFVHGVGLFETMRVAGSRILHPEAHFARMLASSRELGFENPTYPQFVDECIRAVARTDTNMREAALRCVWIHAAPDEWRMVATVSRIPTATLRRRRRGRVVTLGGRIARSLPAHKLTSYAACVVGLQQAIAAGADEGLFVDARGRILEGTSTNVFAVDRGTLITPPLRAGILPGVTRALVIDHARSIGCRLVERKLTEEDLIRGSFLTGSLTTIAAIRMLDGIPCRTPSAEFLRAFREIERGRRA